MHGKPSRSYSRHPIILTESRFKPAFSYTAASQESTRYLCGAAHSRSRGAGLPECENHLKGSARFCFRFSVVRFVASALCVTNCSALPIMITRGRGIGCKLTRKARSGRHRLEGRFGVNKCCWSATFEGGPTWFAEKGSHGQGNSQRSRRGYCAITGAKQGPLASRLAAILVAMYGAMSKPGSCSYCGFGRGPEPLILKFRPPSLAWIQQLFLVEIRGGTHPLFSHHGVHISVAHRRSCCDDGSPLLRTALQEV
jgi:hypothetical protein